MLDSKLQIKAGQTLAILHNPCEVPVAAKSAPADSADAILVFATNKAELKQRIDQVVTASKRGAMTWIAYPKAKQLGTDLNRDIIHEMMPSYNLDTVRQIAIDDTWSALRLKAVAK